MRVMNLGAKLARRLTAKRRGLKASGAAAILAGGMMFAGSADAQQLFFEDFEGLTLIDNAAASDSPTGGAIGSPDDQMTDFTRDLPTGWSRDNTTTPAPIATTPADDKAFAYFGGTVLDRHFWFNEAGQSRGDFANSIGNVLVFDPDQYEDGANTPGFGTGGFNAFVQTPAISLAGVNQFSLELNLDSSFRPYDGMTGLVDVSFDGGTTFSNVLTLNTANSGGASVLDRVNESLTLFVDNPASATDAILRFGMTNAGNDWWWAVDNIELVEGVQRVPDEIPLSIEINRDNGEIKILNENLGPFDVSLAGYTIESASGALLQANWTPIAGRLDGAGDESIDDGDWTVLTQSGQFNNLSEATLDPANLPSGGTLDVGDEIVLSLAGNLATQGGWAQVPARFQDVVFSYISNGEVIVVNDVSYVGDAVAEGDFNADGMIDELDWAISRDNQRHDMSGLLPAQAWLLGDLNGDLQNNHADFVAFKQVFDAANGAGSFQAMLSSGSTVPEPGTVTLLVLGSALLGYGFRSTKK